MQFLDKPTILRLLKDDSHNILNDKQDTLRKLRSLISDNLKASVHEVIHRSPKPQQHICTETGIGFNHLTRSALTGPSGCNPQLEWIPLVTLSANNFLILDTMEHMVGRVGVPLPPTGGACTADICRLAMRSICEFGEFVAEVEKATEDNIIKPSERERILKEGYEALQAILTLMEACKGETAKA